MVYELKEVMKKVQRNKIIKTSDFEKEMKNYGYVSSRLYLSKYTKKGLLKKIKRGEYKLLID